MLTFIEAISLAGDRAKQNDDACGFVADRAWVIDGATDMHNAPLTGAADAAVVTRPRASVPASAAADFSIVNLQVGDRSLSVLASL